VPSFREYAPKRRRSTPVVDSAQPSATSPAKVVVLNATLTSTICGTRSGRPPAGGTQVQVAVHWPVGHADASAPSQLSPPSRVPLPQMAGAVTVIV
jgi:hypothetical protein